MAICAGGSIPAGARTTDVHACVVSESSRELEHAELETKLVENTERMRRSSRRSHDLRGKGARMIAVSDQMQRHAA